MTTINQEIENIVEEIVIPILDKEGLELVNIEYKGNRNRGILRVYIDKQSGQERVGVSVVRNSR